MAASKTVFLTRTELAAKWQAIAKTNFFAEVMAFAKGELLDSPDLTGEQMVGARRLEKILIHIADLEDEDDSAFPGSGLNHDLEPPPRLVKQTDQAK